MNAATETTGRTVEALDRLLAAPAGTARVLLRGASVISMDPRIGDLDRGDVLIEGRTIAAVGHDLVVAAADGQAIVVDASRTIAIPGFVDAHRHCWQTQLRRLLPDADLSGYIDAVLGQVAPRYRSEDTYAGTLLAALSAVDAGVTCVLDFCHNAQTPAHTDASMQAWDDARVRAVFTPSAPVGGSWDGGWTQNLARLRAGRFASPDQLLTLRLGVVARVFPHIVGDIAFSRGAIAAARELGIGVSVDAVVGAGASAQLEELGAVDGLLGPDVTYIHCQTLSDGAWRAIVDSGGKVVLASTSDAQLGCEEAIPPVQQALDGGVRPALSVDVECCVSSDLFTQMRVTLNVQRMLAAQRRQRGEPDAPAPISVRDALAYATIAGAQANGLGGVAGSLTPGKQADVVLIRGDDLANMPLNDPVGTVVLGTEAASVDTVLVAGRPRKWGGRLLDADVERLRAIVTASRDHLCAELDLPRYASQPAGPRRAEGRDRG